MGTRAEARPFLHLRAAAMGIDLNAAGEHKAALPSPAAVCRDLWNACAGPVVALPRRGSEVVYLPQAHLAAAGCAGAEVPVALPPHVACRVVDVDLCADPATDEVYARLALVAEGEVFERNMGGGRIEGEDDMEGGDGERKSGMLHMFCKTLTASDTSTHGGFSVPRRAAEDCFPPLDYQQVRPSQELVAKDLHGAKWRTAVSEFIVPYWKFQKSLNRPFCVGMRFKIQYGSEDVNERRSGMITGINEVDPIRWTGSKWRSLLVRWEDGTDCNSQHRLSPWEIKIVSGSVSVAQSLSASSSKRTKLCPQGNLDVPSLYGNGRPDSVVADKLPRVLQGQELMGSRTHRVTCSPQPAGATEFRRSDGMRFLTDTQSRRLPPRNSCFTYPSVGFGESVGFPEVLQGQEISQTVPLFQGMVSDACSAKGGYGLYNYMRDSSATSLGLAFATQGYALSLSTPPPAEVASPSSAVIPQLWLASKNNEEGANDGHPNPLGIRKVPGDGAKLGSDGRKVARTSCMLFGFSLTEKMLPTEEDRVKEGNHETDRQNPRMLDLFGYSHATPGALHALCAAPLGM
ncbi:hypothetical protein ACQ4PT_062953 [Festuca glaucescens]